MGGWWGEGDEKFFVDGEKFPSTFGTGSEDYFGYAWSSDQLFFHPLHNQTITEGNKGHISDNRWQIADSIPFQKSFDGYIEKYFPNDKPTLYSSVVYWYLSANGQDPYTPVAMNERLDWYAPVKFPQDIAGITVLEKPVGSLENEGMQTFTADKWENNDQLWWIGEPGAKLNIMLNVPRERKKYKVVTRLTQAPDYGIIQWYLDGEKIGEPMDMYYGNGVIATKEINLGTFDYHGCYVPTILTVEIVGANPAAIKRYMVGIDYIKIK
jgi:hypothetical protein